MKCRASRMADKRDTTPPPPATLHVTLTELAAGLVLHRVHLDQYHADQCNPGVRGNARFSPIQDRTDNPFRRCMAARRWIAKRSSHMIAAMQSIIIGIRTIKIQ